MRRPDGRKHTHRSMTRREFCSIAGMGVLLSSLPIALPSLVRAAREPSGSVRLRRLGKTGVEVSEIGFGGHSWATVPRDLGIAGEPVGEDLAVEMVAEALDRGLNFFDTTIPLERRMLGKVLKKLDRRDGLFVTVRQNVKSEEADRKMLRKLVEQTLREEIPGDVIDILLIRTGPRIGAGPVVDISDAMQEMEKMRDEGKVRFFGLGCHYTREDFTDWIETHHEIFDVISLSYSATLQELEPVMGLAKKYDLGVVGIKAFGRGGYFKSLQRMGKTPEEIGRAAQALLKFVLQNKNLDTCLVGMHSLDAVRLNLAVSGQPTTEEDESVIRILTPVKTGYYCPFEDVTVGVC